MKLLVMSHKKVWHDAQSPTGFSTDGGFPFQMQSISSLFDETVIAVPAAGDTNLEGLTPLTGHNLSVYAFTLPKGHRLRRKIAMLMWFPRNVLRIWKLVSQHDAFHVPLGSDIGTVGLLVALVQKKPVFIRYCGIWGNATTLTQKFWFWLMEAIAGGRNVVLATGSANEAPSRKNPHIQWIFSTSLWKADIENLKRDRQWRIGDELRIITVGRQDGYKGTQFTIQALPLLRRKYPRLRFSILGDGLALDGLKQLAIDCHVGDIVHFYGYVEHEKVLDCLLESDVFCFPTDSEGFPKAVHEALACGLPVVATTVSALPRLIGTENGIVVSDTEPETIASALYSMIETPDKFQQMSKHARKTAMDYSLEQWRDKIGKSLSDGWQQSLKSQYEVHL